jgi:hypothetical protein
MGQGLAMMDAAFKNAAFRPLVFLFERAGTDEALQTLSRLEDRRIEGPIWGPSRPSSRTPWTMSATKVVGQLAVSLVGQGRDDARPCRLWLVKEPLARAWWVYVSS